MPQNKRLAERGNAFFFVLLGIVLFAALAITFTRGMRGNTTARLTSKEVDIAVSEIMTYMQRVERGVDRVRRNNCSENDVSFENDFVTGYEHTPAAPAKCRVFSATGGAAWTAPSITGAHYEFWGSDAVQDIGTTDNELVMVLVLPEDTEQVCALFNKKIGISSVPAGNNDEDGELFTGEFTVPLASLAEAPGKSSACFSIGGGASYKIYTVLLTR
ncbi:MAG: hypothetical protein ACT4OY_06645 [Alphaproteobacteria bacterium]